MENTRKNIDYGSFLGQLNFGVGNMDRVSSRLRKEPVLGVPSDRQALNARRFSLAHPSAEFQRGILTKGIDSYRFSPEETERFLRVTSMSLRIRRHFELFLLLQGEVQHFIPHQIFISAWGDFRKSCLMFDVLSDIPGVRTAKLHDCNINSLLKHMHARWLAAGRRPLFFDNAASEKLGCANPRCALHGALRSHWSVLVHGVRDERDGVDNLYLALNPEPVYATGNVARFSFLVDALITQIDVAFRKVAALKAAEFAANQDFSAELGLLSVREAEIMEWIAEGKTNLEIAAILAISTFTVKNHVQRIFRKLGATNRTEAVAKHRQRREQHTDGVAAEDRLSLAG